MSKSSNRLALIGMMGAGKSTVAEILHNQLGFPWVDVDRQVEERFGAPVATIFRDHGESVFRGWEREVMRTLASSPGPLIVALGGGAPTDPECQCLLAQDFWVAWLDAPASVLYSRAHSPERPLANQGSDAFEALFRMRRPIYQRLADVTVDVSSRSASWVAVEILKWWKDEKHARV